MKLRELEINLKLSGEARFFIQMVQEETGMDAGELFSKMIDLYKQVYLGDKELAWIEGDVIVQKLSTDKMRTKSG